MASGADRLVEFATGRNVDSREGGGGGESFIFGDLSFLVSGKFFEAEFFGEVGSEHQRKGAGDVGWESFAGDFFLLQSGMESFGVGFASGESFDDGTLGVGFEFGVAIEKKICSIRRWSGSKGADGVDAQSRFVEERLKGGSESFVTLGEEGSEGLLAIRDGGVFVFERREGALGGFLVAKDLAELLEVFGELGVVLIKEFGAELVPGHGWGEIALTIESKKDAFEEGFLNRGVIGDCKLGKEEGEGFLTIHFHDAFKARLIEVNEGNRFCSGGDEGDVAVGHLAVVFPLFREGFWIEFSGVDDETVTNRFGLVLWDFPIAKDGAGGSDSKLSVDSPG